MNSLLLLLGFFVFLLFGYATYGRWLHKNTLAGINIKNVKPLTFIAKLLEQIGNSSILLLIPAVSISLFWGWVPALIWLVIAHIICSFTYQLSRYQEQRQFDHSFPENIFYACPKKLRSITIQLLHLSLIFLIAICINFAIEISNKNAGIFFAIFILFPAYSFIVNASTPLNKVAAYIGAACCLAIAIFLPTKLGIFIHGSWQPLAELAPWFTINDKSIFALLFVIGISMLSNQPQHHKNIARFSGVLISLLFILILSALVLIRPELDAPMNASKSISPWFPKLFLLLLFPAIITVYQIIFNSSKKTNTRALYITQQSGSLFDILFAVLFISLLSASIGLGAWSTHYVDWTNSIDILHHFGLGSTSLTEALTKLSIPSEFGRSFIALSFSLLIISICSQLLFNAKRLLPEQKTSAVTNLLPDNNKFPETNNQRGNSILVTLSCALTLAILWNGLTLNIWLLFGMLNWLLLVTFLLDLSLNTLKQGKRQDALIFTSIFVLLVGLTQSLTQITTWYIDQQWFYAIVGNIFLLAGSPLLVRYIMKLLSELKKPQEEDIFNQ